VLGHLLLKAGEIAKAEKLDEGFRVVINDGPQGCESPEHFTWSLGRIVKIIESLLSSAQSSF
jgi:hypothetical protein